MKLLIAEDTLVSRKLLDAQLKKMGHETILAVDGKEALEAFEKNTEIRMAILDWMMPEMDGIDVCRLLRKIPNRSFTYIIMLTARANTEDIVCAMEAGADDYITKPFNAAELEARVNAGIRVIMLETKLIEKIGELEGALTHVKQLQGILPMCAWCKKVRDDTDYWQSVDDYILQHSVAEISHGICPTCLEKMGVTDEDNEPDSNSNSEQTSEVSNQ